MGISIGLTRLFYQLNEVNLINVGEDSLTKVVIIPMKDCIDKAIQVANKLTTRRN